MDQGSLRSLLCRMPRYLSNLIYIRNQLRITDYYRETEGQRDRVTEREIANALGTRPSRLIASVQASNSLSLHPDGAGVLPGIPPIRPD